MVTTQSTVPEFVQLLPAGTFGGRDGRGPWMLANPAAVIAASFADVREIPIDYDHQLESGFKNGTRAPASGWITAMEARLDGLWGRVRWTATAAQQIAGHVYRYLSPVFFHTRDGVVLKITSAALVNNPNLALKALNSAHRAGSYGEIGTYCGAALTTVNAEERAICAAMGISESQYMATRAAESHERAVAAQDGDARRVCECLGLSPEAYAATEFRDQPVAPLQGGDALDREVYERMGLTLEQFRAGQAQ